MKQKRVERVERRRPLVEINLIGDSKPRAATISRRGCRSLFGGSATLLAALLAALIAVHLGLH